MLAMIWNNGPWEWIIILIVILIIFGAGKLPQVLKQMGLGVKAFKDGVNGDDEDEASAGNVQYESVPEQIESQSTIGEQDSVNAQVSADPPEIIDAEELKG